MLKTVFFYRGDTFGNVPRLITLDLPVRFLPPQPILKLIMATKTEIKTALDELAVLYTEREQIEMRRERQLKRHREKFEKAVQPINEKIQAKLSPVNQRIYALEKDVEAGLITSTKADGSFKFQQIESSGIHAEIIQTASRREVSAEKFFSEVPALQRNGESFWSCLSVQIAKAEKFLGEKLNDIADIKQNFKVAIKRK